MASLHCVTCNQRLPEWKEPQYFGQISLGYEAETEVDRAAEDVSRFLQFARSVSSAIWSLIQVADVNPPDLLNPECYLDEADSLCTLLTDLVDEAARRVETLSRLVNEKKEQEHPVTKARKGD